MDLGGHYAQRPTSIPDDIAITGVSGRLPESSNIEEFADNLFKGVDMVNDDPRRWPKGLYDLPSRIGKIKDADLENFDQQFFSVHQKQAECMDPQMRMLLESTHEAIIDAGKNISICLKDFILELCHRKMCLRFCLHFWSMTLLYVFIRQSKIIEPSIACQS